MRIAQVAPLHESVPPRTYGGTERVASFITEELVRQGHDVTLFASGDSVTQASLHSTTEKSLRLGGARDTLACHIVQMQDVAEHADSFDVIHFHTDYLHFPFTENMLTPKLTTLHGRLDYPELQLVYNKFRNQPVVSISNAQRKPLPQANWLDTVYHGLPLSLYEKKDGDGDYLASIGRISPEKRLDRAVRIAAQAGMKLKIAAKMDDVDKDYYREILKDMFEEPHVEIVGEIGEDQKNEFLGNAKALLFPIDWPEPFGMVMIEAMACGTPVIAWPNGSVPEVIDNGVTGFIVDSIHSAADAVSNVDQLDRNRVRDVFENRFSVQEMTDRYLRLYERLAESVSTRRFVISNSPVSLMEKKKIS